MGIRDTTLSSLYGETFGTENLDIGGNITRFMIILCQGIFHFHLSCNVQVQKKYTRMFHLLLNDETFIKLTIIINL